MPNIHVLKGRQGRVKQQKIHTSTAWSQNQGSTKLAPISLANFTPSPVVCGPRVVGKSTKSGPQCQPVINGTKGNWCFKVVGNWRNKIWKDTSHEAKLCCPSFGVSTANFPFPAFGHVGNCAGSWKSQPLQVILLLQPIVDDVSVNNYVPWKTTSSNWVWEFSIHILS